MRPRGLLLLLSLGCCCFPGLDGQAFLHITYPRKVPPNITDNGLGEDESIKTYIITINETEYTVHLMQQIFLPKDFMVYTYNQGGFVHPNTPHVQSECFYQGYIEGFPNSLAIINTCSGLRGILQFENITYGIEHLQSSTTFEHLVYKKTKTLNGPHWTEGFTLPERPVSHGDMSFKLLSDNVPLSEVTKMQRYIELYVVLDKALYNYMGGNRDDVTQSIVQLIGFVNSIFSDLNITIVLSSLEAWTDRNKINTTGDPDELLRSFLQWKNSYLVLRPHDLAFLFVYREKPTYAGATFTGKMCTRNYDAGVALYQKSITMETFSVILAQLVGLNLGMEYDDGKECKCPGSVCVMNTGAVYSNGIKPFSSCSIEDFQNVIRFKGAPCFSNRPNLKSYSKKKMGRNSTPICGNGVLEPGEKCDCGSPENCKKSRCCTNTCTFKRGAMCSNELCCENCKIKARNIVCRSAKDDICDFSEYCNGSSASCPADVYVQNGFTCASNTGFCYKGSCQSPELHCQNMFGKRSRNAPQACYEQINSQRDRFGHCGTDSQKAYKTCSKANIRCGKLICVYPHTVPFTKLRVPVLYAPMNDTVCISLDLQQPEGSLDSMMVKDGTKCGKNKVCINQVCEPASILKFDCDPEKQCSGHGMCNNMKNCHCNPGWAPPNCKKKGSLLGGSVDSGLRLLESDIAERAAEDRMRTWMLLSLFLFLPVAVITSLLVLKWKRSANFCTKDVGSEGDSEAYSRSEDLSVSEKASISSNADKM